MTTDRIQEISGLAQAAAECSQLPDHVRSLAATVYRMARTLAAETNPGASSLYTLEQSIAILERWTRGYGCEDVQFEQLQARRERQQASTAAFGLVAATLQ